MRPLPRWWPLVLVASLVLLGADLVALRLLETNPVSVGEAVERFRADDGGGLIATTTSTTTPPGHSGGDGVSPPTTAPGRGGTAAPTRTGPTAGGGPAAAAPSVPASPRPAEGVYSYATQGYEEMSFGGGARREFPAETTRTIRHRDGCAWTYRTTFIEEHEEENTACSRDDGIVVTARASRIEWFGYTESASLQCEPPSRLLDRDPTPGARSTFTCEDDKTTFNGAVTYAGDVTLVVEGRPRAAARYESTATATGKMAGTVALTTVVDKETGLTLREERHDELDRRTRTGTVHYTMRVTVELRSLRPRT